jgi:hypothetical protein
MLAVARRRTLRLECVAIVPRIDLACNRRRPRAVPRGRPDACFHLDLRARPRLDNRAAVRARIHAKRARARAERLGPDLADPLGVAVIPLPAALREPLLGGLARLRGERGGEWRDGEGAEEQGERV